jgi:hypothetical protein
MSFPEQKTQAIIFFMRPAGKLAPDSTRTLVIFY